MIAQRQEAKPSYQVPLAQVVILFMFRCHFPLQHIERTFHDGSGRVSRHDAGFVHFPFDRSGLGPLRREMGAALAGAETADCRGTYCGWPFYLPLASNLR